MPPPVFWFQGYKRPLISYPGLESLTPLSGAGNSAAQAGPAAPWLAGKLGSLPTSSTSFRTTLGSGFGATISVEYRTDLRKLDGCVP